MCLYCNSLVRLCDRFVCVCGGVSFLPMWGFLNLRILLEFLATSLNSFF